MTPEWASVIGDGWQEFRVALDAAMRELGIEADPEHIDHGVLHTKAHGKLGLQNIVRVCASLQRERWPAIIAEHLGRVIQKIVPIDWETALPRLRLRLIDEDMLANGQGRYVTRPFADQLHLALAVDLPEHVSFVAPEEPVRWGKSVDEVFSTARAATEAEPPLQVESLEGISYIFGDSYFAATHVLWLERYLDLPPQGALVALPERHSMFVLPLRDKGFLEDLGGLLNLAYRRHADMPGAITDQIYWRRGESYVRLPSGLGDNGLWFAPPEEFNDMLTGLIGD